AYMLWMYQRVFLGEAGAKQQTIPDLDRRERAILVPAVALMILMGVFAPFFLRKMDVATASLLDHAGRREIKVQQNAPVPANLALGQAARLAGHLSEP
ncbi:MAG: hypothetical protein HY647_01875, partial [Acidobacteria bacterium]|nr:hypothetical protein [Acidobacteriota bacterium]